MAATAQKANPELWEKIKGQVTRRDKGGKPGQWSARKAQLATSEYKKKGGGYVGKKSASNHLVQWKEEDWGTKSGKSSAMTGERYLPRNARDALSESEYAHTTQKKRADTKRGKQFSAQPKTVAAKTAAARKPARGATRKTAGGATAKHASTGKGRAAGCGARKPARSSARTAKTRRAKAD